MKKYLILGIALAILGGFSLTNTFAELLEKILN